MFFNGELIVYKGICGTITHIGNSYIIMEPPSVNNRSPRIVIFPEYYSQIIHDKDSEK
tara:strand:- start:1011 stop:1184 length:174 start_codon:yes stop_codon:yes gene_type:complete